MGSRIADEENVAAPQQVDSPQPTESLSVPPDMSSPEHTVPNVKVLETAEGTLIEEELTGRAPTVSDAHARTVSSRRAAPKLSGTCQATVYDPQAPLPPADYRKTTIDGETVSRRTKFMHDRATWYARKMGYSGRLRVTQGSYTSRVAASAGTHDGGGALDISVRGMSVSERAIAIKALRLAGFAAWNRSPRDGFNNHIHAIAIGDRGLSRGARNQVKEYFRHQDGLSGDRSDRDRSIDYNFPLWAGQVCRSMGLS
jgi:hypothetical protein